MRFISIFFLLLLLISADFPELKTKQSLENIRFVSSDGKITYYSNKSGNLFISTNYDFKKIIEATKFSQFNVFVSPSKKKVGIELKEDFHSKVNMKRNHKIYVADYGNSKQNAKFISLGVSPKLHLNDLYLSFYDKEDRTINILNLKTQKYKRIKLNNSISPYFTPKIEMISPNNIFYTDINNEGHQAIIDFSSISNESKIVIKSVVPNTRIDFCTINDSIYVGQFSYSQIENKSIITQIKLFNNENYLKQSMIYSSKYSDIGHLKCLNNQLYFLKTVDFNKKLQTPESDLFKLNLPSLEIERLTNFKNITQFFSLDKMIIVPYNDKYIIVEGHTNLISDEILKSK